MGILHREVGMVMSLRPPLNERVMVALDVESRDKALEIAQELKGSGCWVKVGLELYCSAGVEIVRELKEMGFRVFLDLKLHDIPNTVKRTVGVLAGCGADLLTLHCSGGYQMMAEAVEVAREASTTENAMKLIGITVLTSLDEQRLHEELGVERGLKDQVLKLAELGKKAELAGVVASAQEARELREFLGPDFLLITPGIRPAGSEVQDQARTLTPREAIAAGSSYLVVGRPITRAAHPREALDKLWD